MKARTTAALGVLALASAGGIYVASSHGAGRTPTPAAVPGAPTLSLPLSDVAGRTLPTTAGLKAALGQRLRSAVLGGDVAGVVVDAATGTMLFARHPDSALPPASSVKLLTALAALTVLRDQPPLSTDVDRSDNTIYLVGGGDVTLTLRRQPGYPATATLADLARQTVAALGAGARVRLRFDAGGWTGPTLAPGWSPSYLSAGNVSRLSTLELDEGRLGPGMTAPRASDPALAAADAFRAALVEAGIRVRGAPEPGSAPAGARRVAAVSAPPIPALVQHMLTDSDNDLAEALGRVVARHTGQPATFAGAAAAVRATVGRLGVPLHGVRLYDASGLSRMDRVTPRALVTALHIAGRDEQRFAAVTEGLPVAGFTGTLAERYRTGAGRAGAGVVRAKTGTLSGVNALAGQVVDADGRLLLFAFLADHVPLPDAAEAALDRLAATLARCRCAGAT